MDSGIESTNLDVTKLVESGVIRRILAQVDVVFSNSMIESWGRQLKHQWLYLNTLDTIDTARSLVSFFVDQHNRCIPHSAFKGQTPEEMYFATGADVPEKLEAARRSKWCPTRMALSTAICLIFNPKRPSGVAIENSVYFG